MANQHHTDQTVAAYEHLADDPTLSSFVEPVGLRNLTARFGLISDQIARTALDHYDNVLPATKGKPKQTEWTVYAAIVAMLDNRSWVVSCATGTKCTCCHDESIALCILADSHAEVLARRSFVRVLWNEINRSLTKHRVDNTMDKNRHDKFEETQSLLEENISSGHPKFGLRSGVTLHLYVSDSPCGDASLYEVVQNLSGKCSTRNSTDKKKESQTMSPRIQFTGAKVILSTNTNVSLEDCGGKHQLLDARRSLPNSSSLSQDTLHNSDCIHRIAREEVQILCKLRTKSGRSNIEPDRRSMSMSCSDKIVRWCVLGLQGGLLSKIIPVPMGLSSVVVSRDLRSVSSNSQLVALERAISRRIASVRNELNVYLDELTGESYTKSLISSRIQSIQIPFVGTSSQIFPRGKSSTEQIKINFSNCKRQRIGEQLEGTTSEILPAFCVSTPKTLSPAGLSINWNQSESDIECTVGARGVRHGKKPKVPDEYRLLQSRISRQSILNLAARSALFEEISNVSEGKASSTETTGTSRVFQVSQHTKLKTLNSCSSYNQLKQIIFRRGPLSGWLCTYTGVAEPAMEAPK